ncbi:MAG: extensin family protein [Kofleriaceae bacterium]
MIRRLSVVAALALLAPGANAKVDEDASAKPAKSNKKKKKSRWKRPSMKNIEKPADADQSPAHRYGMMSREDCETELATRGIPFEKEEARGVYAPVRITGPIRGVTFRTNLDEERRATTNWEIADCRLVLALDDFAEILSRHDIVDVRHYSMYRPPSKKWPEDKIGTRHNGAVAIDAARFIASDGTYYDVLDHFSGRIDAKTCGPKAAPRKKTKQSLELRAILCEAVEARLFNIVLTPNYNRAHRNHFHLEVTGAQWFLIH